ncbi:hypothetical protein V8E36_001233 [Tilletia maclaganii]
MRSELQPHSSSSDEYQGSDWDEAVKKEIEEADAVLNEAKSGKKRKKTTPTRLKSSKAVDDKRSSTRRRSALQGIAAVGVPESTKEPEQEPPPRKIKRSGKYFFGPKWVQLKDGRYQYIHDEYETVSGSENRNPLWDLLGMDREGRLNESPGGKDSTEDDEKTVSEWDDDHIVLRPAPASAAAAFRGGGKDEGDLNGEAPLGLHVNTLTMQRGPGSASSIGVPRAGDEASKSNAQVALDSATDSDFSPDELRKRKRAKMRTAAQRAAGVKLEAPTDSNAAFIASNGAAQHFAGSNSTYPLQLGDSDSDQPGEGQQRKGKGKTLSRPTWWGKDEVEELPEDQLGPRPNFVCSDEVKRVTQALVLGRDEHGNTVQVPKTINRFLRDYQREGIKFFYSCYAENRGGILGDDMGLGKTCQTVSFLAAIMDKKGLGQIDQYRRKTAVEKGKSTPWPTALVICPNSVVENWCREFDMWGWFEYKALNIRNFNEVMTDFDYGRLDVIIATHDFVTNHIDEIGRKPFGCIVVDEVHRVKNADAARTKAYNSFVCKIRFGLTGTAVQNDFSELHTILDWSNPGLVGNKRQWDRTISMPLKRLLDSSQTDQSTRDEEILRLAFVQRLLPKFYLRRDKRIIADQMPEKRNYLVFCALTDEQVIVYQRLLHFYHVQNAKVAKDPCGCGRRHPETGVRLKVGMCCWPTSQRRRLLMWITILKQASDHLALLYFNNDDNRPSEPVKYAKYVKQREICKVMYPDEWMSKRCTKMNGIRAELCGKWRVLQNLLHEWKRNGDKVLVFTQNIRLLDWLDELLQLNDISFRRLDGSTQQVLRQSYVDDFNYSPEISVFIVSTMAGGVGLNLTAANKVVIFDPHWNPAIDQQAQDRAYRIGQTRDVDVYRLIGSGSLEERIFRRQIFKQQLANLAYGEEKQDRHFEGMKDVQGQDGDLWGLQNLFKFEPRAVPVEGLIEATNLEEAELYAQELEQAVRAPAIPKATQPQESTKSTGTTKAATKVKKGKARSKDDGEEEVPETVMDPMEALVVQDQVLAEGSETEDEDPSPTSSSAEQNKAEIVGHGQTRSVRRDQLVPSGPAALKEQLGSARLKKLRRIDDVPLIEHHGSTIIIGRPNALRAQLPKGSAASSQGRTGSTAHAATAQSTKAEQQIATSRQIPATFRAGAIAAQSVEKSASTNGASQLGSSQIQIDSQSQSQSQSQQSTGKAWRLASMSRAGARDSRRVKF